MSQTLDTRIEEALTDSVIPDELMKLIGETEQALTEAISTAADISRRAMDPIEMPNANIARASVEDAENSADA